MVAVGFERLIMLSAKVDRQSARERIVGRWVRLRDLDLGFHPRHVVIARHGTRMCLETEFAGPLGMVQMGRGCQRQAVAPCACMHILSNGSSEPVVHLDPLPSLFAGLQGLKRPTCSPAVAWATTTLLAWPVHTRKRLCHETRHMV